MKKNTQNKIIDKDKDFKKEYISPSLHVTHVEMESGLAASSALVTPAIEINGSVSSVPTDWEGEDTQVVTTPF